MFFTPLKVVIFVGEKYVELIPCVRSQHALTRNVDLSKGCVGGTRVGINTSPSPVVDRSGLQPV